MSSSYRRFSLICLSTISANTRCFTLNMPKYAADCSSISVLHSPPIETFLKMILLNHTIYALLTTVERYLVRYRSNFSFDLFIYWLISRGNRASSQKIYKTRRIIRGREPKVSRNVQPEKPIISSCF